MQHLMIGDKSLLIGDEVADLLLRYAALVGRTGSADSVRVHALGSDGDAVVAGILLNSGTALVTETSHTEIPAPDNFDAVAYLRDRIAAYDIDTAGAFGLHQDDGDGHGVD